MDDMNKVDSGLHEIQEDALGATEAVGGNKLRYHGYIYEVVSPIKEHSCTHRVKGDNPYPRKPVPRSCSACAYMVTHQGYWLCEYTRKPV